MRIEHQNITSECTHEYFAKLRQTMIRVHQKGCRYWSGVEKYDVVVVVVAAAALLISLLLALVSP